jgi:hypothetical protein
MQSVADVRSSWVLAMTLLTCSACASHSISVLAAPNSPAAPGVAPIRVVIDASSVRLPLRVAGDNVVFSDLDRALERAVDARIAASRDALARRGARPLELLLEIVQVRAENTDGRLLVEVTTRTTLREQVGPYLAQAHARASASGAAATEHGVLVVRQAVDRVAAKVAEFVATFIPP